MTDRLDPAQLASTLDDIDRIGNRFHGTPGEVRARDYMLERFESVGLQDVRVEPFEYLSYEAIGAACRVVQPEEIELLCRPLQFTADSSLEGEAVFLGQGTEADLDRLDRIGVDLRDRVVVCHTPFPFLVTPLLKGRDIGAFVNISDAPDGLIADFTAAFYPPPLEPPWEGRPLAYPGVTIEAGAGRELLSLMSVGAVRLHLQHSGRCEVKEGWNVVGEVPAESEERVVVGAHYDSQADGPCIWDNATGLATLIELGRILGGEGLPRGLVLAAFAAEEIGLYGSTAFTRAHAEELDRTVGMVNLDALGSRLRGKRAVLADESIAGLAVETALNGGWEPEGIFDVRLHAAADYFPFSDCGVPSCQILEFPPANPYYHTRGDVLGLVDVDVVAEIGEISGRILRRLATEGREAIEAAEASLGAARAESASIFSAS